MAMHCSTWAWAAAVCAILSSGCSGLPDWSLFGPFQTGAETAAKPGAYDFSWRLTGSRQAGPLQVFDDGRNTWLQFGPDQPAPAVFARTERGDQLLTPRRQGPYLVLDGVWPLLILRAGGLESRAQRLAPGASASLPPSEPVDEPARESTPETPFDARAPAMPVPESAFATGAMSLAVPETAAASAVAPAASAAGPASPSITQYVTQPVVRHATQPAAQPIVQPIAQPETMPVPLSPPSFGAPATEATAFSFDAGLGASLRSYRVSPEDGNMRLTLARWASSSGWTFEAEHWAVDVDIPIVGTAEFQLEFDAAVQQLLASTELSDRPLQPCFYANRVLRVVPYAQSCDRTAALERA